jgi:SAM-dependent methyltransferase
LRISPTKAAGSRRRYLVVATTTGTGGMPSINPFPGTAVWRRRKLEKLKQAAREVVISKERRHVGVRRRLAGQYLSGSGLEIGALHIPLRAPRKASVQYVDRFEVAELRRHYPELDGYDLVAPDIIDDGEALATVAAGSMDFIIANHMIEHCEDPIGTLQNMLGVLKPGGVIYMAVPDCRFTFDRDRERTTLAHLLRDHAVGPAGSRRGHYEEWAQHIDGAEDDEIPVRAAELELESYSIHYHVFTPANFLALLVHCRTELGLPLEVEALERNDHEFIVILSRSGN